MRQTSATAIVCIILLNPILLPAQDIPFVWGQAWGVGARAMAMGGAYTAVSDDHAAMYYNPAGLGQVRKTTLSGTLSFLSMENKATFMGTQTTETPTTSRLTDLGLCFPVPTSRGSLAFGLGYHRVRLLDSGMLSGSNVQFSKEQFPPDGYEARWENERIEEGSMSNTSIGMSIEAAPGLFLGGGMNIWGGDDDYTWQFREIDQQNLYTYSDSTSTEHIATDFSGFNFSFGALLKLRDRLSLGATIKTPVTLRAKESWDYEDRFNWDPDQGKQSAVYADNGGSEYKISAPWILSGGIALHEGPVLVSVDGEMVNYSEMKYTTDPPQEGATQTQANMEIKRNFRNVYNVHVGAELALPFADGKLRAGYAIYPSYLKNDGSNLDRKVVSFGAGFRFMERLVLDGAVSMTSWTPPVYDTAIFDKLYSIQEKINARNIYITLSYLL